MGLFPDARFYSINLYVYPYAQYHIVLINVIVQ